MRGRYIPNRGDVVWISFNPQAGHEQAGRRPALVISPASYNGKVGLKNLDWRAREAEFICKLPQRATLEVLDKLGTLLSSEA
jgi:mRNA interferase MazF